MKKVLVVGKRKNCRGVMTGPEMVSNRLFESLKTKTEYVDYFSLEEKGIKRFFSRMRVDKREYTGNLFNLMRVLYRTRYDTVHISIYFSYQSIVMILACGILNIDVVYTVHGLVSVERRINRDSSYFRVICEKILMRYAKVIVPVSRGFAKDILAEYPAAQGRISPVMNGVDNKPLPLRNHNGINLVTVGVRPVKQCEIILDAVSLLTDNQKYSLSIVGDGDDLYGNSLRARYGKVARFKGFISADHVKKLYAGSDIYIQASSYEPCGLAILEALIQGIRIIIPSSLPIAEDISSYSNLYLFDGTSKNLAEVIIRASLRKLKQNNLKVRELSWDFCAIQYENIYNNIHINDR